MINMDALTLELAAKELELVAVSEDKSQFSLLFVDGTRRVFGVFGDCCSTSWIEHLEAPADIRGARILSIEDSDSVPFDGHDCATSGPGRDGYGYRCGHEVLRVYNTRFHTTRGTIVLEYRNDSNGYYGGFLEEVLS
jgi:hypothetical protein